MSLIITNIFISLFVVALSVILYLGFKKQIIQVISYKYSLSFVILYNINLILFNTNHNDQLNQIYIRLIPILSVIIFRNIYLEFYKSINKVESSSIKIIFVRVVPIIISFIFFVDYIRIVVNTSELYANDINSTAINTYHFLIELTFILYQLVILLDILKINIMLAFKPFEKNKQLFLSNSLIILIAFFVNFMIFALGLVEENMMFSGFVFSFLIVNFILNYFAKPEVIQNTSDFEIDSTENTYVKPHTYSVNQSDDLTGLLKREFFMKTLEEKSISNENFIVLVVSIRGMKLINESFGYDSGDEILQEISIILSEVFRKGKISRLNGGNFAILLTGLLEEEIDKKIGIVTESCTARDGYLINLSFGKYIKTTSELTASAILLRAKEDMYSSRQTNTQNKQNEIADVLYRNFGKRLPTLSSHLKRCSVMCKEFAEYVELPEEFTADLVNGALLHDVALNIMPTITEYNIGFANELDKNIYRTHVTKGFDIVIEAGMNTNVAQIILHHHEHFDGSGYPYKFKGDNIPYLSQIVSIFDLVDMIINQANMKNEVERILRSKTNVEFSEDLVYNVIAFLKDRKLIE